MSNLSTELQPSIGEKMLAGGTAACIADLATFPFDVAKVRLQIGGEVIKATSGAMALHANPQYRGLFGTMVGLAKNEGVVSLYGGIGPGLQRQCVFASMRLGLYDSVKNFYANLLSLDTKGAGSAMTVRIMSGITTGAIAITFAQPTDVVKIRMQAQTRGKAAAAISSSGVIRYKNSIQAYKSIYKIEGIKGLWKGLGPNMVRNSVVNAAELVSYDTLKDLLLSYNILKDGMPCHFTSAFGAGFIATIVASPIDVVKTRYMNSGNGKYANVWDCTKCLAKEGGFFAFYKGFTPSFMRLGSWNVVMFVTFEQLKRVVLQVRADKEH